jgi:SAM-dependent methyltransferase
MAAWSSETDREFHDALFAFHQYDPFTFAYPGYVTIRRFADLASEHLSDIRHACDLGCGPGEITCELARRHPAIRFSAIDHSTAAIDRAREHARRLGLSNISFESGDIADAAATLKPDIVLMFDAFHHLLDAASFVRGSGVDRFFLIEPAGTWLGGWQRSLDLDWIAVALDDIRARLAWELGEIPADPARAIAAEPAGQAVEHRYPIDDFRRFFSGFGLDVRGTVAGFDRYPPNPHGQPPLGTDMGRITYDALVSIEDALFARNLDLHAKHWAIYAERGAADRLRTPAPLRRTGEAPRLQGAYDADYVSLVGPSEATHGTTVFFDLTLTNRSWRTWEDPIHASYHWLDSNAAIVVQDGARSPLPRAIAPGAQCTMSLRVETPSSPGRYVLAVDLVEEGVTWFSVAGAPMLRQPVRIS